MNLPSLDSCLSRLEQHDPQIAQKVVTALVDRTEPLTDNTTVILSQTLLWALTQTPVLVATIADGLAQLLSAGSHDPIIETYFNRIADAGYHGPAFANLMALHLPGVLQTGDNVLLEQFDLTITCLHQIGTYTLTPTFKVFTQILTNDDLKGAKAYLKLLVQAFSHHMTYNRSVRFCHVVPKGVAQLGKSKRHWQLDQMIRVVKLDLDLGDAVLEGIKNGLNRLNAKTLARFVSFSIKKWRRQSQRGIRVLALTSQEGSLFLQQLSTSATLKSCREEISRYLQARLGRSIPVRPLAQRPFGVLDDRTPPVEVCTDGTVLYLSDEVNTHTTYSINHAYLLMLVRLEAGLLEFGTFHFDRHLFLQYSATLSGSIFNPDLDTNYDSDLEWFVESFPDPRAAATLLTLFEHGRLLLLTRNRYPGLYRRVAPFLASQMKQILKNTDSDPLHLLYADIGIGNVERSQPRPHWVKALGRYFRMRINPTSTIFEIANVVATVYPYILKYYPVWMRPFTTPYGRGVFPKLHAAACRFPIKPPNIQQSRLKPGQTPYLKETVKTASKEMTTASEATSLSSPDLKIDDECRFRYPEWRADICDYLPDHTCVVEQDGSMAESRFYTETLEQHRPLVRHIRRAFEQMRPQKLNILRPWKEGDDFDLTQLTEYAISRGLQQTLPERLYIKRVKSDRNVAVQLLVDLSRSTANPSRNSHRSVLEIVKEALVLFCEALYTLGDNFAIAGFSGKGRQQVSFRHIKKFEEPLNTTTFQRIGAMVPIQATRMGAAIRHAAFRLQEQSAKVRLLIVLGDGFPNDIDYKKGIAIADTRRAIQKAVANHINVHGITVNMAADPQLNDLYGPRQSIITDVRDLPAKLLHIYRQLTL